ncbi:MAG: hypothetical protein ACTSYD_09655 [Candidatus Heimdallarchaeaceae archaeon]
METNNELFSILLEVDKIFRKIDTESIIEIEDKKDEMGIPPKIEKKDTLSKKVKDAPSEILFEWERDLEIQLNNMFSDSECKIKHFFYIPEKINEETIKDQIIIPHSKTSKILISSIDTVYVPFFVIETTLECIFKLHMKLYSRVFHIPSTIEKEIVHLTTVDLANTNQLKDEDVLLIKEIISTMRAKLRKVLEKPEALSQNPIQDTKILVPNKNIHTFLFENHFFKILQPKTFELEIDDEITNLLHKIENEQKLIDDETAIQFKNSIEEIIFQKQKELQQNLTTIQREFAILKEKRSQLESELKNVNKETDTKKRLQKEIQEFKIRKEYLSKQVQNLKLLRKKLEKWKNIITRGDIDDFNALLFSELKGEILKNMQKIESLSPAETLELLQKNSQIETKIKNIKIFCINIPLSIIYYSLIEKEEKKSKIVLFHLTNEIITL